MNENDRGRRRLPRRQAGAERKARGQGASAAATLRAARPVPTHRLSRERALAGCRDADVGAGGALESSGCAVVLYTV